MGISGLWKELQAVCHAGHISQLRGQRVGVDAYCWMHRAVIASAIALATDQPCDRFIAHFMSRIELLQRYGVTPVVVFDGASMPMKGQTDKERREKRQKAQAEARALIAEKKMDEAQKILIRAMDVTKEVVYAVIQCLQDRNIEVIVAPREADAQLAFLCNEGHVQAVVSEDSDLLVYNCQLLVAKLDGHGNCDYLHLKDLPSVPSMSSLTREGFIMACILAGCDYLASLPSVGIKTALKVVHTVKTISVSSIVQQLAALGFSQRELQPYEEGIHRAYYCFKHHLVFDPRTKTIMHFTPLREGIGFEERFLGSKWDPETAESVCLKMNVNPNTLQPYENTHKESVALFLKKTKGGQTSLMEFGFKKNAKAPLPSAQAGVPTSGTSPQQSERDGAFGALPERRGATGFLGTVPGGCGEDGAACPAGAQGEDEEKQEERVETKIVVRSRFFFSKNKLDELKPNGLHIPNTLDSAASSQNASQPAATTKSGGIKIILDNEVLSPTEILKAGKENIGGRHHNVEATPKNQLQPAAVEEEDLFTTSHQQNVALDNEAVGSSSPLMDAVEEENRHEQNSPLQPFPTPPPPQSVIDSFMNDTTNEERDRPVAVEANDEKNGTDDREVAAAAATSNNASQQLSPPSLLRDVPCPHGYRQCGVSHSLFHRCYLGKGWSQTQEEEEQGIGHAAPNVDNAVLPAGSPAPQQTRPVNAAALLVAQAREKKRQEKNSSRSPQKKGTSTTANGIAPAQPLPPSTTSGFSTGRHSAANLGGLFHDENSDGVEAEVVGRKTMVSPQHSIIAQPPTAEKRNMFVTEPAAVPAAPAAPTDRFANLIASMKSAGKPHERNKTMQEMKQRYNNGGSATQGLPPAAVDVDQMEGARSSASNSMMVVHDVDSGCNERSNPVCVVVDDEEDDDGKTPEVLHKARSILGKFNPPKKDGTAGRHQGQRSSASTLFRSGGDGTISNSSGLGEKRKRGDHDTALDPLPSSSEAAPPPPARRSVFDQLAAAASRNKTSSSSASAPSAAASTKAPTAIGTPVSDVKKHAGISSSTARAMELMAKLKHSKK